MTADAEAIHARAVVIDATCPLAVKEEYLDNYIRGGVTVIAATAAYGQPELGTLAFTMKTLGTWFERLRRNPDRLLLVRSVDDILRAKKEGKLGIIFHFQGTLAFEDDLNTIELYHRLGLRVCQLCYNTQDRVGCGCAVDEDTGLTDFGKSAIREMNRLGIVVDCAHTGYRTTLDAIAASEQPVIVSHGNAQAVFDSKRNLPDDIIRAVAENKGVIGINGYPGFVSGKTEPTLDDFLDHVDHMVRTAGIDHVCIGMDYFEYQAGVADDATARLVYDYLLGTGTWKPGEYPPPPWHWPCGIDMPEKFGTITRGLVDRGYSESDIQKILGRNLMNVFGKVWL